MNQTIQHTGTPDQPGLPEQARTSPLLITIASYMVLAPLNSTMIAVALPKIGSGLSVSLSDATWLATLYLVTMAAVQPIAGSLGDTVGRRRLMLAGLILFGLVSLGAGIAGSFPLLLIFRVIQAVGIGLVLPNGVALIRDSVPEKKRGSSFGIIGAISGLAAGAGPPLGGVLMDFIGWQAIFYVNVPLVAIALYLGIRNLPRSTPRREPGARFDRVGAIALPSVILGGAVVFTIIAKGEDLAYALVGGVFVSLAATWLLRYELRHSAPVFPPRLFKIRSYAAASAGIAASNMTMYMLLLGVPLLLEARGGYSDSQVGMILASLSVSMLFLTPVGGRAVDRFGRKAPTILGLALVSAGSAPLALEGASIDVPLLMASLSVAGLGLGFAWPGLQTSSVESVSPEMAGAASGMYSTARYFGSITGSAIIVGLIGAQRDDASGIDGLLIVAMAASFVALAASLFLRTRPVVQRVRAGPG